MALYPGNHTFDYWASLKEAKDLAVCAKLIIWWLRNVAAGEHGCHSAVAGTFIES